MLSPIEQQFVDNYLTNGFDQTKAYHVIKPNITIESARVAACKWMKKPQIANTIQLRQQEVSEKVDLKTIASKESLILEAHKIGSKAFKDDKLSTALSAVETKAKLNNVYDNDKDAVIDYTNLIQNIVIQGDVNINKSIKEDSNTLDINAN